MLLDWHALLPFLPTLQAPFPSFSEPLHVRFISHIMWTDINHSNCFLYFTELIRHYCQILWSNFDIPCTVVYYGQVYP